MATVFLAHDVRHDRKVAIKVLKPELAAVLGAERFVQEIKTTAALSHPHILPLFDSGEADGFLCYVMPYLQGETIREKLNRETQFGIEEAGKIATEVAEALDYAHQHGVLHRDIKPENILLHNGRPMVMDFGIALAVSAAAGGRMTETGLSLGTPHYMSPEQATAEKEITARSDQYSLASVLYEMLAGQPPHVGGTIQATFPVVFPDGKTIGFMSGNVGARRLSILAEGQGRFSDLGVTALVPLGFRDGHLLYVSSAGTLVALPLDLKTQRRLGDGVQLESGVRQTTGGSAYAALSRSGTLLYVTGETRGRLMLSSGEGKPTPLLDDVRDYRYPRFAPDGRKVAVVVSSDATTDIWIYDRIDRTLQKLTSDGNVSVPEWSPDGKKLLYRRTRDGMNEIWWQPADGGGTAEPLYQGEPVNEAIVSPDAKWLVYRTAPQSKYLRDILVRPMVGDTTSRLLVGGPPQESHPRVSPDGRWLAYQSNDAGVFQVYVRPFPNDGGRMPVSTAEGTEPLWSRSGDRLYYRAAGGIVAVSVSTTPTFALRERRTAFAGESEGDLTHQNCDVSPDGKLLVVQSVGGEAQIVLVHGWGRELRQKLAVGKR